MTTIYDRYDKKFRTPEATLERMRAHLDSGKKIIFEFDCPFEVGSIIKNGMGTDLPFKIIRQSNRQECIANSSRQNYQPELEYFYEVEVAD